MVPKSLRITFCNNMGDCSNGGDGFPVQSITSRRITARHYRMCFLCCKSVHRDVYIANCAEFFIQTQPYTSFALFSISKASLQPLWRRQFGTTRNKAFSCLTNTIEPNTLADINPSCRCFPFCISRIWWPGSFLAGWREVAKTDQKLYNLGWKL